MSLAVEVTLSPACAFLKCALPRTVVHDLSTFHYAITRGPTTWVLPRDLRWGPFTNAFHLCYRFIVSKSRAAAYGRGFTSLKTFVLLRPLGSLEHLYTPHSRQLLHTLDNVASSKTR